MSSSVSTTGRSGLVYLVAAGILWGTGGLLGALVHRATGLSPVSVLQSAMSVEHSTASLSCELSDTCGSNCYKRPGARA